jgi:hypothetical protein
MRISIEISFVLSRTYSISQGTMGEAHEIKINYDVNDSKMHLMI